MSLPALTAYLSLQEPGHTIDSAYALEQKYRLAAQTVISQLHAHHYTHTPIPSPSNEASLRTVVRTVWIKQETQLDRIERKLDQLLSPTPRQCLI